MFANDTASDSLIRFGVWATTSRMGGLELFGVDCQQADSSSQPKARYYRRLVFTMASRGFMYLHVSMML